jgi:ribosomal protein S12 methylthiotransferase
MGDGRYWLHTLGCPKNQVDSDKLEGQLARDGYVPANSAGEADLLVVNTCAFIEAARQESIDAVLDLADGRKAGARLVVTGCMAERYGDELAAELPEVDLVAGFGEALAEPWPTGVQVQLGLSRTGTKEAIGSNSFDLLELPRPANAAPWAYIKVAEGCDRICGFCAIPSFRGKQRSRHMDDLMREVQDLVEPPTGTAGVKEIVLVAQDLASFGRDRTGSTVRPAAGETAPIVVLTRALSELVPRTRLLYLYPSGLTDELIDAVLSTGVPYFDLSLQHVSRPLVKRMRRWGDGTRFLDRIADIRHKEPQATFRSSFILGYPGETEEDHDELLSFIREANLDWAGFFPFSNEVGTFAAELPDQVPAELALERLRECADLQDAITAERRDAMVGRVVQVLVDAPGVARTVHEAPEIDGIVNVPVELAVGQLIDVEIIAAMGPDLDALPVAAPIGVGR